MLCFLCIVVVAHEGIVHGINAGLGLPFHDGVHFAFRGMLQFLDFFHGIERVVIHQEIVVVVVVFF